MTIPSAFDAGVDRSPDLRLCWIDGDDRAEYTFAEVGSMVRRVSAGLRALGLGRGAIVAAQLPNRLEGLVLLHATIRAGLVYAPILPTHGPADVGRALATVGASAFIGADLPDIGAWRAQIGSFGDISTVAAVGSVGTAGAGVVPWHHLLERATGEDDEPDGELGPDSLAAVLFTSGSTGRPKAVLHTHGSLLARASTGVPGADPGPHTELSILPSGHIGGIIRSVRAFVCGIAVVTVSPWGADRALDVIERHRVTTMGLTPFFLAQLIERQRSHPRDTSSLRHVLVGGANVKPDDVRAADALGWRVVRSYGSTEHPMSFVGHVDDPVETRATTDGSPACGAEARIVRADGTRASVGDVGEIQVRGPAQCAGYLDATATADAFEDGWFRTGDLGRLDASGSLTVTGRIKDIIIRGGENISAGELEELLLRHPRIVDAAVVGYPDDRYGERVCAVLVVDGDPPLGLDDVRTHFRNEAVDVHKTPERVVVIDRLPRTEAGKVAKDRLRAEVASV